MKLNYFTYLLLLFFLFSCRSIKPLQNNAPLVIRTGKTINIDERKYQEITIAPINESNTISGYICRVGSSIIFMPKDSNKVYNLLSVEDKFIRIKPKPVSEMPFFKLGIFTIKGAFNGYTCFRKYKVVEKTEKRVYSLIQIEVVYFKKNEVKLCFSYTYERKIYKSFIVIKTEKLKNFTKKRFEVC
ncbi:MAG: hypothetical protein LBS50_11150 [Prevotellaceae bacterium]|jgi:hypothetical protein|nr:hypothetical protein [Prevotellaceae bacterium]